MIQKYFFLFKETEIQMLMLEKIKDILFDIPGFAPYKINLIGDVVQKSYGVLAKDETREELQVRFNNIPGYKTQHREKISSLMARTFLVNKGKYSNVENIDGDIYNNNIFNIRWVSDPNPPKFKPEIYQFLLSLSKDEDLLNETTQRSIKYKKDPTEINPDTYEKMEMFFTNIARYRSGILYNEKRKRRDEEESEDSVDENEERSYEDEFHVEEGDEMEELLAKLEKRHKLEIKALKAKHEEEKERIREMFEKRC